MRVLVAPTLALCFLAGPAAAGETGCRIENGALVVPAAFGAIAGDFLFDPSQPVSQLHLTTAQGAGITADTARGRLRLAGETLGGVTLEVVNLDAREQGFVTNISGVLGADVLRRYQIEVRFSPCVVTLARRLPRPAPGAWRSPVVWIGGAPAVAAAIADRNGSSGRGLFAIDTGSVGSRIAGASLSRSLAKGEDAASRTSPPARIRAISLAGDLFEQSPAGTMADAAPGLAGALGLAVWTRYVVRLDLAADRIELTPSVPGRARSRGSSRRAGRRRR